MINSPALEQFRLEPLDEGFARVAFDMPGRTINVFSEAAIREIEAIADWLPKSGPKGIVIVSGKTTAFCT